MYINNKGKKNKERLLSLKHEIIKDYVENKFAITPLAKKYKAGENTIRKILINENIPLRDKKTSMKIFKKKNISSGLKRGYQFIYDENGDKVAEHRYIVEKSIGRKLLINEVVHHIDGDKTNNKLDNLQILSIKEHMGLHASYDKVIGSLISDGIVKYDKENNLVYYKKEISPNQLSWKHFKIYLCGPMEYANDMGLNWRKDVTAKLISMGFLESNIMNPCDKPLVEGGQPLSEEVKIIQELKDKEDWKQLDKVMKKIMSIDLRMVDKCDLVIANFSETQKTFGSTHECILARQQHKPVLLINEKGIEDVSSWMIALVGHKRIFTSTDEALLYLQDIKDNGLKRDADLKDFVVFNFDKKDSDKTLGEALNE